MESDIVNIKFNKDNYKEICEILKDSCIVRMIPASNPVDPDEFCIIEIETQKGFMIKEGSTYTYDRNHPDIGGFIIDPTEFAKGDNNEI